jgi:hypothetical protein
MKIDFYIHTYNQDPTLIIGACKKHFPDFRIFLLADGDGQSYNHIPCFNFPDRLKPQPNGGAWLKRWYQTALDQKSDIIIKIDPDSKIHRPFQKPFPDAPLFGAVLKSPKIGHFIHGGSMCMRRSFLESALPLLDNDHYKSPCCTMRDKTASSDLITAHVAQSLKAPLEPWSEVTYFPLPWPNQRYAISHGRWHKEWHKERALNMT